MKKFAVFSLLLCAISLHAGILSTNLLPLATYSAQTITNSNFIPPQTHSINPHTFTLYHSATNNSFPCTNLAQITFDGGQTWATYATFVTGTNSQTEVWTPITSSLIASNRLITINSTNQTLLNQASWVQ